MAKQVRVDKDTPVPEAPTKKGLAAALKAATAEVDTIAADRHEIRATLPKGEVVAALADRSDDAYAAALAAQAAAEKAYGRFTRGGGPGQRIPVGTATEGEG